MASTYETIRSVIKAIKLETKSRKNESFIEGFPRDGYTGWILHYDTQKISCEKPDCRKKGEYERDLIIVGDY